MADDKRYYWVKLDYRRFEHDGDLDYLMGQKDGEKYVVLYMMLCLQTRNTGGEFITKLGDVVIPYDVDRIVRDCKYFSRDTVIVALELYKQLGLVYVNNGGFLQINNFDSVVGSECSSAKRVREFRQRQAERKPVITNDVTAQLQCNTDVTQDIRYKREDIRDKSKEKDDIDMEEDSFHSSSSCFEPSQDSQPDDVVFIEIPTNKSNETFPVYDSYVSKMQVLYPAVDVKSEIRRATAWCINNPKNRKTKSGINRFLNSWLSRAQNNAGRCVNSTRNADEDWMSQIENDPRYKGDGDITQLI